MADTYTKSAQETEEQQEITIRKIKLSDVDDLMEYLTDEKVSHFCVWNTYTSKDEALDYIKNIAIPHPWSKVICIKDRAIGAISVTPNSGNDICRAELGYVLAYKYWGKGIVTKAVKMVICSVFVELPYLERLEALVDLDNKGSQRVLQKAGFQKEGILKMYKILKGRTRDFVIFAFLSTDNHTDLTRG